MLICASTQLSSDYVAFVMQHPKLDVNAKDKCGRSALYLACRAGSFQKTQLLLWHPSIDADARTNGGETPLMAAV